MASCARSWQLPHLQLRPLHSRTAVPARAFDYTCMSGTDNDTIRYKSVLPRRTTTHESCQAFENIDAVLENVGLGRIVVRTDAQSRLAPIEL